MAYNILILGRTAHPDGKETASEIFKGLVSHFAGTQYDLAVAYYNDILFDIEPNNPQVIDTRNQKDLKDYDAVLMTNWFSHASIRKDIAFSIGLYLQAKGVPFFNTESAYSRSTSKLSQMMVAALHNVTIPRTVFSLSYKTLTECLADPAHTLGEPFILKDAQASRGGSNYLLHSYNDLAAHASEHNERNAFMAQAFVTSDHSDFRLFIAGGKVQFIIRRIGSQDSHLHNTSQGAKTMVLQAKDIAPTVIKIAEKMATLLHREVTGLDIIFDKGSQQPYFLEANPIPQIATGSNVPIKLAALADSLKQAAHKKKGTL